MCVGGGGGEVQCGDAEGQVEKKCLHIFLLDSDLGHQVREG